MNIVYKSNRVFYFYNLEKLNSFNLTLFHLASDWTITAFCSVIPFTEKLTGFSMPLRSSFIPVPSRTAIGADTLTRLRLRANRHPKFSFIKKIASSVLNISVQFETFVWENSGSINSYFIKYLNYIKKLSTKRVCCQAVNMNPDFYFLLKTPLNQRLKIIS